MRELARTAAVTVCPPSSDLTSVAGQNRPMADDDGITTIMVTGGTGLVGMGIKAMVDKQAVPNERWIYLSSKDGDLRCVRATERADQPRRSPTTASPRRDRAATKAIYDKYKPKCAPHVHTVEAWSQMRGAAHSPRARLGLEQPLGATPTTPPSSVAGWLMRLSSLLAGWSFTWRRVSAASLPT